VTKRLDAGISEGVFEPVILNNRQKWIDGESFPENTHSVNPDFSIVLFSFSNGVG
jgi:hypothetical protein